MTNLENFISCDWGTSNFRLRLVDKETLNVIRVVESNDGVKKTYNRFREQDIEKNQTSYFLNFLKSQLKLLKLTKAKSIVVISGMVSSSIGMLELDYASLPFGFDANELNTKTLTLSDDLKIIIVSGVRSNSDVMRGEEIQAIGLAKEIPSEGEGILILPGTHSKHVNFKNGVFEDFTSYMTGELFETIRSHTILKNSLESAYWKQDFEIHFKEGVLKAIENKLFASLFNIRTNDLFNKKSNDENFYFLSGLLIGAELSYLKNSDKKLYLATSGTLLILYKKALSIITENTVFFEEKLIDQALLLGHKKIANHHV